MPRLQFVEKVFFDKLGDFEKVCKKPHFRPSLYIDTARGRKGG